MNAAKHTPGPWMIAGYDKAFVFALNEQGYNRFCAQIQRGHAAPMEKTSDEEIAANGLLIAAAPELLEACQEALRDLISDGHSHYRVADQLREVIAKATGEQE